MTLETSPLETFLAPRKPNGSDSVAPMMVLNAAISIDWIMAETALSRYAGSGPLLRNIS